MTAFTAAVLPAGQGRWGQAGQEQGAAAGLEALNLPGHLAGSGGPSADECGLTQAPGC